MEERNIIRVIHDEILARKEWLKEVANMTQEDEVEEAGVSFVYDPVMQDVYGGTTVQVHRGIERVAAEFGVEVSVEKESLETATYTDITTTFIADGIRYIQLDTSPELWEKEKREYEESQRRQEDEENGKQSI